MTEETDIAERLERMRTKRLAFNLNWHAVTKENPPSSICDKHGIARTINVEKSLAESWTAQDYKVVFRKCYKCVGEEIEKQKNERHRNIRRK